MIPEKSKEILENALKLAGRVLLEHKGTTRESVMKENISSVLTEADLAAERTILEVLGSVPGSYNIISEESGFTDFHSEYTWVVDPLDGTSNFAAGLPWFGIIIALFHMDRPVLGGMYLPDQNDLYMAQEGLGSWKNGQPIKVRNSSDLSGELLAYSFDFSDIPGKTESEMEILLKLTKKVRNIRSTNSLVDFCCVADGRLGAAINQSTKIWDIAVPWLMIREAGGIVTDISGNEIEFLLQPGSIENNYTILASGPGIQQELRQIIIPE